MVPARAVLLLLLCSLLFPRVATPQYMFLDSNGDGINTEEDVLNGEGPTSIDVYLDTNHDRDGSLQTCNSHSGAPTSGGTLNLFGYTIVLRASGGEVSWGTFTASDSAYSTLGSDLSDSHDTKFERIRPPTTFTGAGKTKLGSIPVVVTLGDPAIGIGTSTSVDPSAFGTGFATSCQGSEFLNTYVLGTDWFDTDGIRSQQGQSGQLMASVPAEFEIQPGQPSMIVGKFSSNSDSLGVTVEGLPAGFHAVRGEHDSLGLELRAYGALPPVPEGTSYGVTWMATDETSTSAVYTTLRSRGPQQISHEELQSFVRNTITGSYPDGMGHERARDLGVASLPILADMLRDTQYKKHWYKAAQAIGDIGDTSYFDTLYSFIWTRFHGEIDWPTEKAMHSAQGSLSSMATISSRVLEYLVLSTNTSTWLSLPWSTSDSEPLALSRLFAKESLIALAYTDADRASDFIDAIPMPADTTPTARREAAFVKALRRVRTNVRQHGLPFAWNRARQHGGSQ